MNLRREREGGQTVVLEKDQKRPDYLEMKMEVRELENKNQNLKDDLDHYKKKYQNLKNENKGLKSDMTMYKSYTKEEYPRQSVNRSPDDLILQLRGENDQLKAENEKLRSTRVTYYDDLKKKKRVLLNELCNLVNSKNNFETSFYSELTKTSDQ